MIAKKATMQEMEQGLKALNEKYDGNIRFKRIEQQGNNIRFTLTVCDSSKKGARRGFTGKRLAAACWHAHGDYFEALLSINNNIEIRAGTKVIDKFGGNWQDWNIGSLMQPLYYSEACDCEKEAD